MGVLLDSLALYAWEYAMLKRIANSDFAEIVLLVISDPIKSRTGAELDPRPRYASVLGAAIGSALLKVHRALEAKIQCKRDAFELRDSSFLLSRMPKIAAAAFRNDGDPGYPATDLDGISALGVDVFVQLGASGSREHYAALARYGVWSLAHGRCGTDDAAAAGFWPVYYNWPVIESLLLSDDGQRCIMLARSFSGTNRFSVKLNRSALYWKTSSLVPRKLEELQRVGPDAFFARVENAEGRVVAREQAPLGFPTATQLVAHIARNVRRRADDFLFRNFMLDRWMLLYHLGEELSTSIHNFKRIVPPRDRYWADPHVVRKGDRFYVFVEEFMFSTRKGHIAVLVIDDKGRQEEGSTTILERDYHMSYPCVFQHGGEFFMIPESSENRTVDLYRCTHFPSSWEYVTTLLKDMSAVDSTMLYHEGKWWLFTNIVENEGASFCEELFLFHSDSLVGGKWTPHIANPIVSDVRKARPAGAIFRRGGKLCRPAQDCSVRYGYAMTVNHITAMSEYNYDECVVETIMPTWDKDVVATHTLAYAPGLTVVDALQPRLKF